MSRDNGADVEDVAPEDLESLDYILKKASKSVDDEESDLDVLALVDDVELDDDLAAAEEGVVEEMKDDEFLCTRCFLVYFKVRRSSYAKAVICKDCE